jgi:hypothetical protein
MLKDGVGIISITTMPPVRIVVIVGLNLPQCGTNPLLSHIIFDISFAMVILLL